MLSRSSVCRACRFRQAAPSQRIRAGTCWSAPRMAPGRIGGPVRSIPALTTSRPPPWASGARPLPPSRLTARSSASLASRPGTRITPAISWRICRPSGEFASVAESILAPSLQARRSLASKRQRIAASIASGAFRSVFQPIVDLRTGGIVGFEALTRFDDGCRPDVTFAAAVECGMGMDLETVTFEGALRESRNRRPRHGSA